MKILKTYEEPEMKVIFINSSDIIATSLVDPEEDDDNTTGTIPFVPWG